MANALDCRELSRLYTTSTATAAMADCRFSAICHATVAKVDGASEARRLVPFARRARGA
jgi:hypothetical protein